MYKLTENSILTDESFYKNKFDYYMYFILKNSNSACFGI